jgi:hypothetical protein
MKREIEMTKFLKEVGSAAFVAACLVLPIFLYFKGVI